MRFNKSIAATHPICGMWSSKDWECLKNLRSSFLRVLCSAYATAPSRATSINEIMPMIGARFYSHVEAMQIRTDLLENDLCKVYLLNFLFVFGANNDFSKKITRFKITIIFGKLNFSGITALYFTDFSQKSSTGI